MSGTMTKRSGASWSSVPKLPKRSTISGSSPSPDDTAFQQPYLQCAQIFQSRQAPTDHHHPQYQRPAGPYRDPGQWHRFRTVICRSDLQHLPAPPSQNRIQRYRHRSVIDNDNNLAINILSFPQNKHPKTFFTSYLYKTYLIQKKWNIFPRVPSFTNR